VEPIFEAVLKTERALSVLLAKSPGLARARAGSDYLVESIPHWLYTGDTPLHLASAALRVDCAGLLLECGADVNAQNRRGARPLHYACDPRPRSGGVWDPDAQTTVIGLLIRHGADVDAPDKGGATALHRAVRARSAPAVRQLLKKEARVDTRFENMGSTPLHLAVQSTGAGGTAGTAEEQLDIIRLLLKHGARETDRDYRGRQVIECATSERIAAALRAY
jgi:ankyrin repeat protein